MTELQRPDLADLTTLTSLTWPRWPNFTELSSLTWPNYYEESSVSKVFYSIAYLPERSLYSSIISAFSKDCPVNNVSCQRSFILHHSSIDVYCLERVSRLFFRDVSCIFWCSWSLLESLLLNCYIILVSFSFLLFRCLRVSFLVATLSPFIRFLSSQKNNTLSSSISVYLCLYVCASLYASLSCRSISVSTSLYLSLSHLLSLSSSLCLCLSLCICVCVSGFSVSLPSFDVLPLFRCSYNTRIIFTTQIILDL